MSDRRLFATEALLPSGWARDVLLAWDAAGRLTAVSAGVTAPPHVRRAAGPVLPGMPNLHSHAFQRAMAGLTEFQNSQHDSFWSWRSLMYRFVAALRPEQLEAIATWNYVEMLEAGYTSVYEFHYIHNDVGGAPFADGTALAERVVRAAARAGIGLTLLPALYQASGFGRADADVTQRRFVRSTESMLELIARLKPLCDAHDVRLGLAPHSLRAVPPASLRSALHGLQQLDATAPIHIHVAEQAKEVEDCVAWSGARPVQWLLDHADVDGRWCLIHATHMSHEESYRAARAGVVVGLCPTTEANLGDGIFDMPSWIEHVPEGGGWGIGSDSNACVNAAEELMMLEYSQRLRLLRRNVLATADQPDVATAMTLDAVIGGTRAAGRGASGGLRVGQRADFVTLDATDPAIAGLTAPQMLSAHVFGSHRGSAIHDVYVAGVERVSAGRHPDRERAAAAFIAARADLLAGIGSQLPVS